MDPLTADRRLSERGISSVQFLLASGLGMLLFLALANLVVVQYGRGALRSALDQGARAGSVSSSEEECRQRIEDVLGQLLGGRMGDSIVASCAVGPGVVTASASAAFVSWTPFTPDFVIEIDRTGHAGVAAVSDRGHAAVELGLAVGALLLPVALAVLAFGPWSERRVLAEAAASEAVRAAVIQLDTSAGNQVVTDMAANHGLGPDLVRLSWCGADGSGPDDVPESCTFDRGSVVTAEVEVWVPLVATPWGEAGGLWVGASHSELVDLYRSLP